MKNTDLKDGYRYEGLEEGVIFNHYSFCVLVKNIMVKYGHLTQEIAEKKLNNSFLVEVPRSKDDVEYLGHELEFHWAMIATYGEMYWTNGVPSDFNDFKEEYLKWESQIRSKYNLKQPFDYYKLRNNC